MLGACAARDCGSSDIGQIERKKVLVIFGSKMSEVGLGSKRMRTRSS
jgi:hypothetical protein